MNIYTISAVKHDTTVIPGIESSALSANLQQMVLAGSGAVDPSFVAVGKIQPDLTFTTSQVKTALAALGGISGVAIATSNFLFWLQKTTSGGSRAGATSHPKAAIVAGIVVPNALNLPDGQPATIDYLAAMVSADGTASPLAFTADQSLEAGQDIAAEAYTLGAVTLNGSALEGVDNVSVAFNISLVRTGGSGLVYPIHVYIASRRPVITISTKDMDAFVSWGLAGAAQGETDSTIQIDDVTEGSVRGSSPVALTIDEGMVHYDSIAGQGSDPYAGSVVLTPTDDGTAEIIAISGLT